MKKIILPLVPVLALTACSDQFAPSTAADESAVNAVIPAVEAVPARFGSLPVSERLNGTVIAENQVELYPEINGRITRVLVDDGDTVQVGDPLVMLESQEYDRQLEQARASFRAAEASLKQAQANYRELEAEYQRTKMLADEGLASEFEVVTLEAQMASAEAAIELAEARLEESEAMISEREEVLSKTIVRAPITGTVGQRNAEIGMQVSSSTRLFTIGNLRQVTVRVVLTGEMLTVIRIGQPVRIYVGSDETSQQVLEGTVSRISPFLNTATRSTVAEVRVRNTRDALRPGMYVAVDILYGESQQATLIPTSALFTDPETGREGVYVVNSKGADLVEPEEINIENTPQISDPLSVEFRTVEIVAEGRMQLGVMGIEPGEWVVIVGQDLLSSGRQEARVRPSNWERILHLQALQRQDLLYRVLDGRENEPVAP